MYEFKWTLPLDAKQTVTLQIASKSSWIGRKTLRVGDHVVYRRARMEGIEHTFADPAGEHTLQLTWEPISESASWQPILVCDGVELEESTGAQPPRTTERPPLLALVTGVTYLTILMMVVMLPHVWKMLYAGLSHSDSRAIVLDVTDGEEDAALVLARNLLPEATVGQPYQASLAVECGSPPYTWKLVKGSLPDGLAFDAETARVSGAPRNAGDKVVRVRVTDATGAQAERPYVVSVRPERPAEPRLVTRTLPVAHTGEEYVAQLRVEGGKPPYDWVVNARKLPQQLSFDRKEGTLRGMVQPETADRKEQEPPIPTAVPLQFGVADSGYSPYEHIAPWFVPLAATAVCLLGYWNMRRWGVMLYGVFIVGQLGAGLATAYPLSGTAIVLQALVFSVGAAYYNRMQSTLAGARTGVP